MRYDSTPHSRRRMPALIYLIIVGLMFLSIEGCAKKETPPVEEEPTYEITATPFSLEGRELTRLDALQCLCGTNIGGTNQCGVPLAAGCGAAACNAAAPCPQGQFCLVNNCCDAPKDAGVCVSVNSGTCPPGGPFACGNYTACIEP